uniref:Uncharacterized protein n=1 Tax=Arundo donax TaxID=35708 RepID=A0A0A9HDW9_ARUDO
MLKACRSMLMRVVLHKLVVAYIG